jgi:hypothetical protein
VIENIATAQGGGVWGQGDNLLFDLGPDAVIANNAAPDMPDTNFTFD